MPDRRLRVLMLTADYPPGVRSGIGAAVHAQAWALHRRSDTTVHVLVARRGVAAGEPEPDELAHQMTGNRCPVDPASYDVVHLHSLALGELAIQIRRRFARPLLVTAHSLLHLELETTPSTTPWVGLQAAVLRESDRVVTVSASEQRAAVAQYPALTGRCVVVPNGVPPGITPSRPAPDGPVVFAGRFTRLKGFDVVGALAGRIGRRVLAVGGRCDSVGAEVVRRLLRARRNCEIRGWVPHSDIRGVLATAALVVVPSRYEPFGMVAAEAMAAGVPVLAAATSGLRDLVTPDSGGRLVASHEPGEWRSAICQLLDAPGDLRTLAAHGPAHVARHYDPETIADRLLRNAYLPAIAERARVS